MVMFFIIMEKLYILCVGGYCIPSNASDLNLMFAAGGMELLLELVGIVRVYKSKDK